MAGIVFMKEKTGTKNNSKAFVIDRIETAFK